MFCTECGQQMPDEAKFCAYCGTRRVVTPAAGQASAPAVPEPKIEAPPAAAPVAPPPLTIRSTAEIMPVRVRPVTQRAAVDAPAPESQVEAASETPAAWQPEENSAPLFASAQPVKPPAPPVYEPEVRTRAAAAAQNYEPVAPPLAPAAPRYQAVPFAAEPGQEVAGARRKISPVLFAAIIVALIALAGIIWMVHSSMSLGGKAAAPVGITIYPTSAKVAPGKGVDFVAEVTGAPTSDVTWSVEEGDTAGTIKTRGASAKEDTISLYCTYTAPAKAGTYHLTATSTADKSKSATAEITVVGK
jgi:zinc ribbon protein/immunoglobulin I-set domain protein